MLKVLVRRSRDVSYLTQDRALELDEVREGPAAWWLRGAGDLSREEDVGRVLCTSERSQVVGYDLVVAAPRPLSLLIALDPGNASRIVTAHRRAVSDTLEYLEDHALVVRERRGGEDIDLPGRWTNVVGFTHGVNRHGEPHLHDHVLVAARPEGARGVLDSRALFAHARAADAVYRASLRADVARSTPYVPWRSFEGVEHVKNLDEGYRALWGGHYDERQAKRQWSREEVRGKWANDLTRYESHGVVAVPERSARYLDEHAFGSALEGRHSVARRHVIEAWANASVFGSSAHDVKQSVNRLYPSFSSSRGVREVTISVPEARMIADTRARGPRPLDVRELDVWFQRSRERSRDIEGRSR